MLSTAIPRHAPRKPPPYFYVTLFTVAGFPYSYPSLTLLAMGKMARLGKSWMSCCIWPLGWEERRRVDQAEFPRSSLRLSHFPFFMSSPHPATLCPKRSLMSPSCSAFLKPVLTTPCSEPTLQTFTRGVQQLRLLKITVIRSNHILHHYKTRSISGFK